MTKSRYSDVAALFRNEDENGKHRTEIAKNI